ncbi:hypothetical protein KFU94_00700 [Chloroflexi bacterium TSY]|nr:hypothetical protein [Chloroflexi bacterium TSY]
MFHFPTIFQTITNSGLPMSTELVGLKLLVTAQGEKGPLALRWDELLDLCRVRNPGSVTRHLARLSQTGVLHFAVNGLVTIEFVDSDGNDLRPDEERAGSVDQIGAPTAPPDSRSNPETQKETHEMVEPSRILRLRAEEAFVVRKKVEKAVHLSARPLSDVGFNRWQSIAGLQGQDQVEPETGDERAKSARQESSVCLFVDQTHIREENNKQTDQDDQSGARLEGQPERVPLARVHCTDEAPLHHPTPNSRRRAKLRPPHRRSHRNRATRRRQTGHPLRLREPLSAGRHLVGSTGARHRARHGRTRPPPAPSLQHRPPLRRLPTQRTLRPPRTGRHLRPPQTLRPRRVRPRHHSMTHYRMREKCPINVGAA